MVPRWTCAPGSVGTPDVAAEQLPAAAQAAITAAAVDLIKAGHAGVEGPTFDRLVMATLQELHATYGMGAPVAVFAHLLGTMGRVSVRLAHGWDEAVGGAPAAAYLAEVATLAARGRD